MNPPLLLNIQYDSIIFPFNDKDARTMRKKISENISDG